MKNILLSFLFFSLSAYGQWVEIDTGMEVSDFSDVYAISTNVAVVVGSSGTIIKTTDGGETWEQKDSGTTLGLAKVQFATPNIGYVIGGNGTFLKTTDAGETWANIETGISESFRELSVVNENLVFVAYHNHILKTENGGESWESFFVDSLYSGFYQSSLIQFFNSQVGYVHSGDYGEELIKTIDGGTNWQSIRDYGSSYFLNPELGFYYSGYLFKTVDGGDSFYGITNDGGEGSVSQMFALNENTIWTILDRLLDGDGSTRGVLKISSSDTETYTEQIWYDSDDNIDMWSIHFANETTGYIVGYSEAGATIWKNSTGINEGELNVNEVETSISIKVYPNPTSSELNIDLSGTSDNNVVVSLMDVTGKQVFSKSYTREQIKINTQQFVKGTYILQVKTNDKNYTQKVIIN